MNWLTEPLAYEFNQRALLTGALIGFANGYLSGFVVMRRSALIVGSLSHSILPGLVLGVVIAGLSFASMFLGALFAALLVGLSSVFVARSARLDGNSALAILYTTAFAGGLLALDRITVNVELEHWLFGNILGLADHDLWVAFVVSLFVLGTLVWLRRPMLFAVFDPAVAETQGVPVRMMNYLLMALLILALITSLQVVGCILSVSLMVAPAAIVMQQVRNPQVLLWGGGIVGLLITTSAVILSYWLDVRTGSLIVVLLGAGFLISFALSGPGRRLFSHRPPEHARHGHDPGDAASGKAASDETATSSVAGRADRQA